MSPSSSGAVFGYPSWKVIVSAQRGQYSKPGSHEPGFFCHRSGQASDEAFSRSDFQSGIIFHDEVFHNEKDCLPLTVEPADRTITLMFTNLCATAVMKKASLPGASDRRAH
jgi:hypothetical protein